MYIRTAIFLAILVSLFVAFNAAPAEARSLHRAVGVHHATRATHHVSRIGRHAVAGGAVAKMAHGSHKGSKSSGGSSSGGSSGSKGSSNTSSSASADPTIGYAVIYTTEDGASYIDVLSTQKAAEADAKSLDALGAVTSVVAASEDMVEFALQTDGNQAFAVSFDTARGTYTDLIAGEASAQWWQGAAQYGQSASDVMAPVTNPAAIGAPQLTGQVEA